MFAGGGATVDSATEDSVGEGATVDSAEGATVDSAEEGSAVAESKIREKVRVETVLEARRRPSARAFFSIGPCTSSSLHPKKTRKS